MTSRAKPPCTSATCGGFHLRELRRLYMAMHFLAEIDGHEHVPSEEVSIFMCMLWAGVPFFEGVFSTLT